MYEGSYAHFWTRATAVPCMQNYVHTCVYERSRVFIMENELEGRNKLTIPITLYQNMDIALAIRDIFLLFAFFLLHLVFFQKKNLI